MQLTNFISHLKNPDSISNESEIKSLIDEFPYCQTGHLMYAYQLKKENNILFEEQLKKAATFCTDRKRLFEQLHQRSFQEPVVKEIEETETNVTIEEEFSKLPEIVEEKIDVKTENVVEEEKKPLDELEKNYLGAAISSSILLETEITEETVVKGYTPIVEEIDDDFDTSSSHTFSDWLKYYNNEKSLEIPKVKEQKASSKFDLIDKFIQEDPKIEPKKTSFYSPVNMARLSVVDDSELVSETLALIYVEQGSFQEAINAYEKLSLKYPEKRSYFANQIKILKQKIK